MGRHLSVRGGLAMRNDRLEINEKLQTFIEAWESGKTDCIDETMVEAPFTNFSIFGPVYSREILKCRLRDSGRSVVPSQFGLSNQVCRVKGSRAQQSAVLTGVFADGVREDYRFCGMFVNSYVRTEEGWRISSLDFDLMEDNTAAVTFDKKKRIYRTKRGSKELALPEWNLIEDEAEVYNGCRLPSICGELQAPWLVIPEPPEDMTDEEAIRDLFYRYAFAVDQRTVSLLTDIFVDGAAMKLSTYGEFGREKGIQSLRWLKSRLGPRGQHVADFTHIRMDDKFAEAVVKCDSPGIVNGTFELCGIKEGGVWRMLSLTYIYVQH